MIASDNPVFKYIYKTFWSWGFTHPLKNKDGKYEGGPAPVYQNPDRLSMILFVVINLLIFTIILILYLNEAVIKNNENIDYPSNFILGILFSGFNSGFFVCLFLVENASDQEWSRYFIVMVVDFLAQIAYVIVGLYQIATKDSIQTSVKGALTATLCLGVVVTVGLAYLVFSLARKIFLTNDHLAYHDEPQLQVSERLEFL